MMKPITLLRAIGATEPSTFKEICEGLGDACPEKGDSEAWAEMFNLVREGERRGMIHVERTRGLLDTAVLTTAGVEMVRRKVRDNV